MKRFGALGIVSALVGALMFMGAGSASAHTPSVSASCSGVQLGGTNYDASKANKWSATVGGVTTSGTFAGSVSHTIPVPQGGATTSWSGTVEAFDGGFHSTQSGNVGPCGEKVKPPQPPAADETKDTASSPNCDTLLVTTTHWARSIPFVFNETSWTWVAGTPTEWAVTGTDTRHVTQQECVVPPPLALDDFKDISNPPNCTDFTTTTDHMSRTAIFSFDISTWKWVQNDGDWTEWKLDSSTSDDSTQLECPPPVEPDGFFSEDSHSKQECGDAFKTTKTSSSTTDWVLDEATRVWTLGNPVFFHDSFRTPVTAIDCPTKPAVHTSAALPDTGAPSMLGGFAGAGLLILGSFILWFQRRKVAVD